MAGLDKLKELIIEFFQSSIVNLDILRPNELTKPWPRPGFVRPESQDSSSGILQRPLCAPGKSRQGGLDIKFKIFAYEDI
jgi:hypothetical protein